MREIMYRALERDTLKIYFGSSSNGKNILSLSQFWGKVETGELLPDTVCSYTGVKDKGGIRIFEDDTVEVSYKGDFPTIEFSMVKWGSYGDGEYVSNVECWMIGSLPLSDLGGLWGADEYTLHVVKSYPLSPGVTSVNIYH